MAAQYVMEDLARILVRVELASEFRYRRPILDKNALAIIVSLVRPPTVLQPFGKQKNTVCAPWEL